MPLGHVFLAIDVASVMGGGEDGSGVKAFQTHAGSFLRAVRASAKDPNGPGRIWTAGEVCFRLNHLLLRYCMCSNSCTPMVQVAHICCLRETTGHITHSKQPEYEARKHHMARGGEFYIPPALMKDMENLREKFSPEAKMRFAEFPWEKEEDQARS